MRRLLSRLGLCPDPSFRRRQGIEDAVDLARLDYLRWRRHNDAEEAS